MRHRMAMTKNMRRFLGAVDDLLHRPQGTEGMGLLWGKPGEGKTTSIGYVVNALNGVYIRALSSWTVTSLLGKLCEELGGKRMLRRADMVEFIAEQLRDKPRPIFVDEADHLFDKPKKFEMPEALRDIYDITGCPVILVGMEDIARTVQAHGRFARRITQWVEFTGIDLDDSRIVARELCEVELADDLLAYLNDEAKGNIGRMIVGLTRIERMAKASDLAVVTLDQWGKRPLFYDQPVFANRVNGRNGNTGGI